MPSLSHDDAVARRRLIDVVSYDVDLDLDRGGEVFGSTVSIRFTCHSPGEATFVEVAPHRLHRVVLNGVELPVSALADGRFPLPDLAADNELSVTADMEYSRSGEGLHRFTDPEDGRVYTYMMGFLDMASRVFACFEQPDLKAPYRLTVTAPSDWTVIGNESGERVAQGRWSFKETRPLATYFVTLVAGPYHSLYREHDGVRFGLHARQTYREALDTDADELFDVTFGCWDRLHELYGVRYPFGESYDQCFVPEFNAGAMENPGCVTFRDEAFMYRSQVTETRRQSRAVTIAHEMAHMWFGDLVTMRWWDDLWLNESFADCMGVRAAVEGTRFTGARAADVIEAGWGYAADQRPSTHPVAGTVAESGAALSNFDGISYAKGGAVLNQLAAWVGDEAFFAGLRDYFSRHRFGNASLDDLMDCLAAASGRDLADWSRRWLRTTGPNTLRVEVESDGAVYTAAAVIQTAPPEHPTSRPHRVRLGLYRGEGDVTTRFHEVTVDVDGDRTELPQLVGVPVADLLVPNDDDLTYAKVRLDAASLAALPTLMAGIESPETRALLWSTLTDMVRDGELPVMRYLDVLAAVAPTESSIAALDLQFGFARRSAVDCYLPREQRSAGLHRLREIATGLRESAVPGGDVQLSAFRLEADTVDDDAGVAWLRAVLAGEDVPVGLDVDAELRWAILTRLSVLGAAGEADVVAELERDPSSEGRKHAATCRAAFPTAEAKAAAWQEVQYASGRSNHELRAVAKGFWWPEQADLTAEYVSRYFTDTPDGIGKRMPWEIMHLARELFPVHAASVETVAAAERMLDRELDPQLRRVVVDCLDDLRRAIRVAGRQSADTIGR
ncbi:membrane alanyl aminopeptidase [Stackebrandtia albiflava]|uniref:Aminopeptidase N n=1 Tax=Stackebrandtia albiflava TaxID=406432 RepID=A0A562VG69_9ACTN|nr:aminopeptidase N [Stackebrandtia albiflava]TWJ16892.1 membrane alanyl aminopeptidase [Stackebrandtia albiflava]